MDLEINKTNRFPIIGIGASAGGIGEFKNFFEGIPSNINMAFIIVQHSDPNYKSKLEKIISNYSTLKVSDATDKMKINANEVYICPSNKKIFVENSTIYLKDFENPRGKRFPIDYLFRSLAEHLKEKSIGILLSGTGSDGTSGLRRIKGEGGMAMIQDPKTTEYQGMLYSAINNVHIDFVIPTKKMFDILVEYIELNYGKLKKIKEIPRDSLENNLQKIYYIVRSQIGYDLSVYKENTILRRIKRRMAVNNIEALENYVENLRNHTDEITKLFHEMLIGVTNFFRDEEAFKILEEKIIKELISERPNGSTIRVWIPGCSTGEEAYSIAILIEKNLRKIKKSLKIQIFATDIDDSAIETARKGIYKHNISADVPQNILKTYFIEENSNYIVLKKIRSSIIFAVQNVINDPPFSNIDLISCRNLLIYLQPKIQKNLFNLFHYSLKVGGYLFLGKAENVGDASQLFKNIDRKCKIFQWKEAHPSYKENFGLSFNPRQDLTMNNNHKKIIKPIDQTIDYSEFFTKNILKYYIPPTLLVNEKLETLYIHGETSKFLQYSSGKASLNLNRILREEISTKVIATLRRAQNEKMDVTYRNLRFEFDDKVIIFDLKIIPIINLGSENLFFIIFNEKDVISHSITNQNQLDEATDDFNQIRLEQIEEELKSTKHQLKSTISQLEATNQELKSTNEEYLSANEELQSTNEELQTSKEEVQSVNEELITLNNELNLKIEELSNTNDDLRNLIASTEIGTLFLDKDIQVRRFTSPMNELFRMIDSDIGRPLEDIKTDILEVDIEKEARRVLENLVPSEKDVQTKHNQWFHMKIIPYKTKENVIDGVVMTFLNITNRKKMEQSLIKSESKFREAFNQSHFYEQLFTHDMKNILQIFQSSIEILKEQMKTTWDNIDEDHKKLVSIISEQIHRGFKLIENVRKISIIDNYDKELQPINVIPILQNLKESIELQYQNTKIDLNTITPELFVYASNLLEDVFENILINSVKYNDEDFKKIWINVDKTLQKNVPNARIEISDNGIGIGDQLKKKLFKERIEYQYSKGMGIGLTIVKKILDMYKGSIWVEDRYINNEVNGTKFIVLLPLSENN